nr:hypothetical protein [Tanacetum cinerariifolium]
MPSFHKWANMASQRPVTSLDSRLAPTVNTNTSQRRNRQSPTVNLSTSRQHPPASRPTSDYRYLESFTYSCQHCGALFWGDEHLKSVPRSLRPRYNRCCRGGRVVLRTYQMYPENMKLLLQDRHFLENIRAYNQMFSMTSLGAQVDDSVNNGRGPYVFKISRQLYHWIGSLCLIEGEPPRFLQLYIYDTDNEVDNHMTYFGGQNSDLHRDIVEGLIDLLDIHNGLVQLFRTAREKFHDTHVPNFKVRLYNVVGAREYKLPTEDMLGAIVYETGPESDMDYDIVLEERSGYPQHVNKLHPSYMSLQFPLLFIYDQDGYSKDLKMMDPTRSSSDKKRLTMLAFYSYQLHDRTNCYNYLSRTVEFQKRGLPHSHYLLWIHESVRISREEDIDMYVSTELPSEDVDPECYNIVSEFMMHGPCGLACPSASWTDRVVTRISKNGTSVSEPGASTATYRPQVVIDEIKNYLDARYISPYEACWRIFKFDIHYREPAVHILSVHLMNMQCVVFREQDRLDSIVVDTHKKKTTLTGWLHYNERNTDERHLTYLDFPSEFVWYADGKYWRRRRVRTKSSIGRLTYVHPAAGDLFYQRMLLCHQKGCKSFLGIRTVNDVVYPTCRVACELNIPNLHIDDSDLEDYVLYELENCLNHCSKSLADFGLRMPPERLMSVLKNRLLMEEKNYDRTLRAGHRDQLLPQLNDKHRHIFSLIMDACFNNRQELVFVYGHGGTRKTFL